MPTTTAKRRRLAISLRASLLLILVFGLWFGVRVDEARDQRRAIDAIRRRGGRIVFEHQLDTHKNGGFTSDPTRGPSAPAWLRRFVGDDFFVRPASISLSQGGNRGPFGSTDDAAMGDLKGLHALQILQIRDVRVSDGGIASLGGLRRLEHLSILDASEVSDAGIEHLLHLSELRGLDLRGAKLTDEGLRSLGVLSHLEHLSLEGSRITDAGLGHLGVFHRLRKLDLRGNNISDAGLVHLAELPNLVEVRLDGTRTTPEGIGQLKRSRPGLVVSGLVR